MIFLKLKSGALQLTLFISIIIAVLLMGFIMLVHSHKRFQVQADFILETTDNAQKGIEYALLHSIRLKDTVAIPLEEPSFKTLNIHRDYWGIFERVTSKSKIKTNHFQKIALIGAKSKDQNRTALYLQDTRKPLVVVGNTKIEGVVFLPKQGVKAGTISGHSYTGSQLLYGSTQQSSTLPTLATDILDQIEGLEYQVSEISNAQFITIESGRYSNSFFKPVQIHLSNSDIVLNEVQLTGHMIVQSKTKITVLASAVLKDVILIAPEIEIQNNVISSFQAFASKRMQVGNSVQLHYPSALILNKNQVRSQPNTTGIKEKPSIQIGKSSVVKGVVVYLGNDPPNNYKTQIELQETSVLVGELYCNQNTELKGTVYGTVFAKNFIANQFGSIYQNHIYNGKINVHQLPKEYVGLLFKNSKKEVLKWLY
ncbi:hypothetical protein OAD49_00530 [Flavobacteriaceae bacterium]|nr:hypothetical protein [Flavobacteriaceae bacterium]